MSEAMSTSEAVAEMGDRRAICKTCVQEFDLTVGHDCPGLMPLAPVVLPDGEYAIVEVLGHRTIVGRVEEVERFGTKLLSIQPLFQDTLLEPVLIGGGSIYQFTNCSGEVALKRQPKRAHQLPPSIAAVLPLAMLPAPDPRFNSHDEDPLGDEF